MAAGDGWEGEQEGSLGYVLSLPAASLPLPVAVYCLDATVPCKPRSRPRLRAQPCALLAFKLPVQPLQISGEGGSLATRSGGRRRAPEKVEQLPRRRQEGRGGRPCASPPLESAGDTPPCCFARSSA
ncbi:unnamed protein product [Urochloa humidicola]